MQRLVKSPIRVSSAPIQKFNIRHCWWRPYRAEPFNPMYLRIPGRKKGPKSRRRPKVVFLKDHVVKIRKTGKEYHVGWAGEVRRVSNKMYRNELMDFEIAVPATRMNVSKHHHCYTRDYLEWIWKQRVNERIERQIQNWKLQITRRLNDETDKFHYPVTANDVTESIERKYFVELDPSNIRFEGDMLDIKEELELLVFIRTQPGHPELSLPLTCIADHSPQKKVFVNNPKREAKMTENKAGSVNKIPTILIDGNVEKLLVG